MKSPAERHENAFAWLEDDIAHMCRWRKTKAFQALHLPNRFEDQIRAILVDEERIIGWCAFFFEEVRNRERVESILRRSLPAWKALGREDLTFDCEPHFLIVNGSGEPIAANHHAIPSENSRELRDIAQKAAKRSYEPGATRWRSGPFDVVTRELSGLYGRVILLVATPLETPQIDRVFALTCTQHQIVHLFVDGASTGEIAEVLSLSRSTVKYHLRNIYDILRVSSQLELAKLVHQTDWDALWENKSC